MSIKLFCDTETVNIKICSTFSERNDLDPPEPDFILANLSPEKDVTLIDGEGHLVVVGIILKNTIKNSDWS